MYGQALVTPVDSSNHWWGLLEDAVSKVDGKLSPPEISPSATDGRFIRAAGWPAFGFSPISNMPILLHEHNEVCYSTFFFFLQFVSLLEVFFWVLHLIILSTSRGLCFHENSGS